MLLSFFFNRATKHSLINIPSPADMRDAAKKVKKTRETSSFTSVLDSIKQAAKEGDTSTRISTHTAAYITDHHIGMLVAAGYTVSPTYESFGMSEGITIYWQ